jgi:hypothetical protein
MVCSLGIMYFMFWLPAQIQECDRYSAYAYSVKDYYKEIYKLKIKLLAP